MPDVKREGNIGGVTNPKQSPGSGVTKTSSTTGDEGPVTTQVVADDDGVKPNVNQEDRQKISDND